MALGGYAEAYIGLINGVLCVFTRPGPTADQKFYLRLFTIHISHISIQIIH